MSTNTEELQRLISEMAVLIEHNEDPDPQLYALFFQHPEFAFQLVDVINQLPDQYIQEDPPVYSACVFALDICVAQLQAASEANNKISAKTLIQLMNHLAHIINTKNHSLGFWLPILNAFYEVHVELTSELKEAYFNLASQEELGEPGDEVSHLDSIRDLILEMSDLTVFEIAENFFAQSYAMPADFFADLLVDLYNIKEGHDIALLTLLHPKLDVRDIVVSILDQIMEHVTLSSVSLTRMQVIKYWYPSSYHPYFERWIKIQRKKGVVFEPEPKLAALSIEATEVDGTGSQGLFIHVKSKRKNRLCGLLLKFDLGIKDAWITSYLSAAEVEDYYRHAFDENVTLREVDTDYFKLMAEHFLAISLQHGSVPPLQLLEIQELLGMRLRPNRLNVDDVFDDLSVQIVPFTEEAISESLQRSKSWLTNKPFTESWYLENALVDKIVNHNSSFVDGVKVCRLDDAIEDVFTDEMELHREKWQFHFLWIAMWAKSKEKKNEKIWQDSFLIAYSIHEGKPLNQIPVMREVCRQTVINSIETMQERKTHLNKE